MSFRISEDMVRRFALLTGDRSALHVNEAFARRSAYRRPVVHGMLPIGFLALADGLRLAGMRCVPLAIEGHFVAPAYAGDRLVLTVEAAAGGRRAGKADFTFAVRNAASGALVSRGMLTAEYRPAGTAATASAMSADPGMVVDLPEMNDARLEEIVKGQKDGFRFSVSARSLREFAGILADGVGGQPGPDMGTVQERFCLPNLVAVQLLSTSVGICLPGASATFLEFSASGRGELELDTMYRLDAEVTHLSRSTRIVKKRFTIAGADRAEEPLFQGSAIALVNKPARTMPSSQELKASALDPGLKDKVVLVTGASRGIGETTAKLFALLGAKVIVNYHRGGDDAARIVEEIRSQGGEAVAAHADVTQPEDVRALVELGIGKFGAIHVLVNNAARDFRPTPFLQLTWDEVQKDLDVIVKGTLLCCQQAIPHMLAQGGGKIINISTVAVDNPPPDQAKYVLAKSALVGLTRSLSIEFAARNVQVNLVVPNFVETDFVAHVPDGFRGRIARDTPMQRLGSPTEVAQAAVFLASSYSSFTTGQKIMVTGGGAPYL